MSPGWTPTGAPSPLPTGLRRHTVVVQAPNPGSPPSPTDGDFVAAWTDLTPDWRVAIQPATQEREQATAGTSIGSATHIVTGPYRADVTLTTRLLVEPSSSPSLRTVSPLLTNLVSYWKLDEASGTRMDAHGTNHLTPANTPTSAVGKVGNACQLVGASTQYLSHADPTPLGDVDFTYALWFKTTLTGVYQGLVTKQNAYCLRLQDYGMGFFLGDSTPGIVNGPNIADTNWHFVVAWHDAAGNTLNLQLDNAVPASSPTTGPVPAGLSVLVGLGLGASFTGLIDELGLWQRVLTADERTALYNAGAGLAYPFAPAEPIASSGGRAFNIVSRMDPEDRHRELILVCREVVP